MLLIFILGVALAGASFAMIVRGLLLHRSRVAGTVRQIHSYGYSPVGTSEPARKSSLRVAVDGVASAVGTRLSSRLGGMSEAAMRQRLMAAGLYHMPPSRFAGYRVLAAATIPIAWLWTGTNAALPGLIVAVGVPLALAAGWGGPLVLLNNRARRRVETIEHDMPELVDILVVTVEAGLGFSGSLQMAGSRLRGPLGDEIRLTLREQSLGLSSEEALRNLLARCDSPAVRSFVRSVLQGESLGVSIGQILRNLAVDMRKRRRAAAEERAQKAPIKILFPLVFCIFPAMFIVLLAPAVFRFLDSVKAS